MTFSFVRQIKFSTGKELTKTSQECLESITTSERLSHFNVASHPRVFLNFEILTCRLVELTTVIVTPHIFSNYVLTQPHLGKFSDQHHQVKLSLRLNCHNELWQVFARVVF